MRRGIAVGVLLAFATTSWAAAPPVPGSRGFTRQQTAWLNRTLREIAEHGHAGRFEEAEKLARARLALRERVLGPGHWRTRDESYRVEEWQRLAREPLPKRAEVGRSIALLAQAMKDQRGGRYNQALRQFREALQIRRMALGEEHPHTADCYDGVASCLSDLGKDSDAMPLYRKALAIRRKVLGEGHPDTAGSYNNVAFCLDSQAKHVEALATYQAALRISKEVLGEDHPTTATTYNNLAACLNDQGKHQEALPLYQKALRSRRKALGDDHLSTATAYNNVGFCLNAMGKHTEALPLYLAALRIREKALGESHPDTASSYNNLAGCLNDQGKHADALPLYQAALRIRRKVLGEDHPSTATTYNNVAYCLHHQGKPQEALPLFQTALRIRRKALGEENPTTADSYNNVASCLDALGRHKEALPLHRTALGLFEKALGEPHPFTATSHNNVALCLQALGKHAEALPLYQKALRSRRQALGEDHPFTADSYNNVAYCLQGMGRLQESLPLFQRALRIRRAALGEDHPVTTSSYNSVATCLWKQSRVTEAVRLWQGAARSREAVRWHRAGSGFDRALTTRDTSPQQGLAVGLARLGQPRNAFSHAEASLARGLLDDLSSLSAEEAARTTQLRARLAKLEPVLASFAGGDLSENSKARHEQSKREYARLWSELTGLYSAASARHVRRLEDIQKAIPADSALVFWLDFGGEHWGCVVRTRGRPEWKRLRGSGKDGEWKDEDDELGGKLYDALIDPRSDGREREKRVTDYRRQRLDPLRPLMKETEDLPEVKRLFVVPAGMMAHVPAELLDDKLLVSYVPSGSVLARLREGHRPLEGTSLLAVGDPVFDRAPPPVPPASGVLVKSVLPGSHAAEAGLRPGDVLLSVGSAALNSSDDVQGALAELPARAVVWREGKQFSTRLGGSPLGAAFDTRSARAAVRAWRTEAEGGARRGTGHKRLPGTRLEVEAIAALVKGGTLLLGSEASEQRIDELRARGRLKGYRLLHLATHGETIESMPGRSALILAQNDLPDPFEQARQGQHVYDGRLSVSRIRTTWELDADLVVLSACETGLGKEAAGDGLLGFAQAFLSRGARAVVLSRWKVDDTATSLLMIRFYENLLGKRKDLKKPLGRAISLDEAKKWLRDLTRQDAERLATLHSGGVLRGSEGNEKAPEKVKPVQFKDDKPFAHPFYWAAFTLIGDPD